MATKKVVAKAKKSKAKKLGKNQSVEKGGKKSVALGVEEEVDRFLSKFVNKPKTGGPVGPRLELLIQALEKEQNALQGRLKILAKIKKAANNL